MNKWNRDREFSLSIALFIVMGMFTGCTDDTGIEAPRPSDVICFSASLGNDSPTVSTRSTAGHLSIVEEEWRLEGQPADTARTRATLTTSLEGEAGVIAYTDGGSVIGELNNRSFSFSSDELTSTDSPVYWKKIESGLTSMDVYAYAPYSLSGTITGKSFTYTIPGAATDQRDVIVAKSTVASSGFRKTIPLTFTHALTAVRFNLGSDIIASNVNSITLSGVHNSGSYTIGEGWSGLSHSEDVSYTVTAGELLMLMPQTLPDDAKVTLTFKDNTTPAISASLKGQKWEEGKLVTYTLHKSTQPGYIYLDLAAGNVTINATTYSGAIYVDGKAKEVEGSHAKTNKYYVYQSSTSTDAKFASFTATNTGYATETDYNTKSNCRIPAYASVSYNNQLWSDFVTNNTSVEDVIEIWDDGRNVRKDNADAPCEEKIGIAVVRDVGRTHTTNYIKVTGADSEYDLTIDNIYSVVQEPVNSTQKFRKRSVGGIAYMPTGGTALYINLVGDNRMGCLHIDNKSTDKITLRGTGSLTAADADFLTVDRKDTGGYSNTDFGDKKGYISNFWNSAIGNNTDDNTGEDVYNLCIESGVIFAGTTKAEDCTAIGAGGNGDGRVYITGGTVTAVATTAGTAIGGGMGHTANGGPGTVTIAGGNIYAYNFSNRWDIPSAAIGGGGSLKAVGSQGTVTITGGNVYAQSATGAAIGGGSSSHTTGGGATVIITGGNVVAKSVPAESGLKPGVIIPAGAGIGGGTGSSSENNASGGNATVEIWGNAIVRTGSVGGGQKGTQSSGTIGSATITISGNPDIQAQFVLAKGTSSDNPNSFTMDGGTIRNSITDNKKDTEYPNIREEGGAVWLENGTCTIRGGTIENCTATEGGAIYIKGTNNPTFTMTGGTIKQCTSQGNGGAVYLEGGTVTLEGGTISDNLASGGHGGGIYIEEGSFYMPKNGIATITENSAIFRDSKGGDGGGLYVTSEEKDVTVELLSGTITQNTSDHWGGGVCVDMSGTEQAAKVTVGTSGETDPDISGNHTLLSGGGLYVSGEYANIIINGGNIDGNSTSAYVPNVNVANEGGMVTLIGGNVSHKVVTFYANDGTDTSKTQKIVTATNSLLVAPEFKRTGYRLAGWNTRADGRGASYTDGQTMNITADLTLYAQWGLQ